MTGFLGLCILHFTQNFSILGEVDAAVQEVYGRFQNQDEVQTGYDAQDQAHSAHDAGQAGEEVIAAKAGQAAVRVMRGV